MKRLILVLVLLAALATPKPASAYDGYCSSQGCYYSGYYVEWSWFGFYACYWWQINFDDGHGIYGDCHSNSSW